MKLEQYKGLARLRKIVKFVQMLHDTGIWREIGQGEFVTKADAMPDDMLPSTFTHYMKRGVEFGIIEQNDSGAYRLNRQAITELEISLQGIDTDKGRPTSYKQVAKFLAPFATFRGWLACLVIAEKGELNLGSICHECSAYCTANGIKAKNGRPFHFHQGNMSATMKALIETGVIAKRKQGRDSIHFVADAEMLGKLAGLGEMYFKG